MDVPDSFAWFDGQLATDVVDRTSDASALDGAGWWAVVVTFEGDATCLRFGDVRRAPIPSGIWTGPDRDSWTSSLDRAEYVEACQHVRRRIAEGDVYQANICRVLETSVDRNADVAGLATRVIAGNPAPHAGVISAAGVQVVSASPELFLRRAGDVVESRPIKGTGRTAADLAEKDRAENVMIVDLVRNDLSIVAEPGTVEVPALLATEQHPGLVHLVSTVTARLRRDVGWPELLAATFPPGSVTGAPKSSALRLIRTLEPVERGPYCGAVGWVDGDARRASLAVGIRTFWLVGDRLRFGTGAGITWGSDPQREWDETELKAERLLGLASSGPTSPGNKEERPARTAVGTSGRNRG